MALRHPWFSQNLKRKHPDDLISDGSNASGSGVGTGGTAYGGVSADAHNAGHDLPPNQGSDSNGRATKRIRKFESRNLERGFAELSIQPTSVSSPPHIQQQQQQPDTRAGGDDVWSGVVGGVGQSSCVVVCPDGSTLPLLRPTSVDEPPSSDVNDIQMSTQTWYEPEKDSESPGRVLHVLTTLHVFLSTPPDRVQLSDIWNYRNNRHEFGRRRIRRRRRRPATAMRGNELNCTPLRVYHPIRLPERDKQEAHPIRGPLYASNGRV